MKFEDYYAKARADWPNESESFIRFIAEQNLVHDARRDSVREYNAKHRKFCVEVPKDTKTVNINININEAPHQDCACQQILVRMLNGKEYWL